MESKRESLAWSGLVWLVEVVRGKVLGKSAHSYSSLPEPSESPSLAIWCQLGLRVLRQGTTIYNTCLAPKNASINELSLGAMLGI